MVKGCGRPLLQELTHVFYCENNEYTNSFRTTELSGITCGYDSKILRMYALCDKCARRNGLLW